MANTVIVIPTYNPTHLLISTLRDLYQYPALQSLDMLLINDGSEANNPFIQEARKNSRLTVIEHTDNKGKGAAIKTAIKYIIDTHMSVDYIITVDSDGQHLGKDVITLLESITQNGDGVHIGARRLEKSKTPLRSFIGNAFSRKLFAALYACELQDTQSGLRVYPSKAFHTLLSLKSNRYEFEMEAIIELLRKKIKVHEIPIETVYFNKNKASHFRPLKDSSRVIWVILKLWIKRKRQ